jgi:hypothetical protein
MAIDHNWDGAKSRLFFFYTVVGSIVSIFLLDLGYRIEYSLLCFSIGCLVCSAAGIYRIKTMAFYLPILSLYVSAVAMLIKIAAYETTPQEIENFAIILMNFVAFNAVLLSSYYIYQKLNILNDFSNGLFIICLSTSIIVLFKDYHDISNYIFAIVLSAIFLNSVKQYIASDVSNFYRSADHNSNLF